MMEITTFTCTICGENSKDICVACTKDTCANHLCERCKRCSDCCVCEVRLIEHHAHNGTVSMEAPLAEEQPEPEVIEEEGASDHWDVPG